MAAIGAYAATPTPSDRSRRPAYPGMSNKIPPAIASGRNSTVGNTTRAHTGSRGAGGDARGAPEDAVGSPAEDAAGRPGEGAGSPALEERDSAAIFACSEACGVMPSTLWISRERRSEEHTSELQSRGQLVCRLLLATEETEDK